MTHSAKNRSAFTLVELLVVLAILVVLAAIAIPKVIDTFDRSRAAAQAYSTSDISRHIENFYALNSKYPDGWDSLTDSSGGLYSKLATEIKSPNSFLTTAALSSDQIASLSGAGIGHIFLHDAVSAASDSGTDRRHFGSGSGHDGTANVTTVAVIDTSANSDGMHLLVDSFGLNPNRNPAYTVSTADTPRIAANTYVVFGVGPRSTVVQSQVQEAPIFALNGNSTNYARALVVFEVPNSGTNRAKFVGAFGPDGRSKKVALSHFNNPNGVPTH